MTAPDNSDNPSGSLPKGILNALLTMFVLVCIVSLARHGFEFGHWLRNL